jgi:hypothetical protein
MIQEKPFGLGAIPDRPDPRDYIRATAPAPLPDVFSLQEFGLRTPWNQGQIGACSGYSTAAALETLFGQLHPGKLWAPAPLYLYYKARELGGTVDQDTGAALRDMMKVLVRSGVAPLFVHPTLTDWRLPPSARAEELAGTLKIKDYQRILVDRNTPTEMMRCLHQERLPLIVSVQVFSSVYGKSTSYAGEIPLPTPEDTALGFHALMIDAYDVTKQCFSGWNSWGKQWGWGGRFSLPFEWLQRWDLTSDIWSFSTRYW